VTHDGAAHAPRRSDSGRGSGPRYRTGSRHRDNLCNPAAAEERAGQTLQPSPEETEKAGVTHVEVALVVAHLPDLSPLEDLLLDALTRGHLPREGGGVGTILAPPGGLERL